MTEPTVADAIAYYDDLLRGGHAEVCAAHLARETAARQLYWGDQPSCRVLRPMFTSAKAFAAAQRVTEHVTRGVRLMYARIAGDAALRARLFLPPSLAALAEIDLADPATVGIAARLDGFHGSDGQLRFVEYNCFPGGIIQIEELGEVFEQTEVFRRLRARFPIRRVPIRGRVVEALRKAHGALPAVGYLRRHPDDGFKAAGHEMPIHVRHLIEAGGRAVFGTTDEFELVGGRLACRGRIVDVIGCDDWPDLLAATRLEHPVFHAARARTVRFLNGMGLSLVLGSKLLFALLSDEAETTSFDAETRRALARHVPWTRYVCDSMTTYEGERVDLLRFIAEHRAELVLKPAMGHGGEGVVIGHLASDDAWQRALRACASVPHVVQQLVSVPAQPFPLVRDGALSWADHFHDYDPYVWNTDEVAGVCVRLSATQLLNVSAGGSVVPLFLVG